MNKEGCAGLALRKTMRQGRRESPGFHCPFFYPLSPRTVCSPLSSAAFRKGLGELIPTEVSVAYVKECVSGEELSCMCNVLREVWEQTAPECRDRLTAAEEEVRSGS